MNMDPLTIVLIILSLPYWISVFTVFTHLRFGKIENKELPMVSAVIPTRNEGDVIEKTLKKVRQSDYPKNKLEIIVVDANSTDNTVRIARKYADKVVIEKRPKGKPHALNVAIRKSKGDIIYILDADSWVEKSTIKNLVLRMDGHKAIMGLSLPENKENFVTRIGRLENAMFIDINLFLYRLMKTSIVPGKNYAVYKKVIKKIGGFQNALTEDINVSFRLYNAGYKIKFVPAKCYEQIPDRLKWFIKQQRRWSMGGINEIKNALRRMPFLAIFVVPVLGLLALTSAAFLLSFLSAILFQNIMFLIITIPSLIVSILAISKYLDGDDLVYLPATLVTLGVFQVVINLYAFFSLLIGKKVPWEKTPKLIHNE